MPRDYHNQPITAGIVEKERMEQPRCYWNPVIAPSEMAFYHGQQFPGGRTLSSWAVLRGSPFGPDSISMS